MPAHGVRSPVCSAMAPPCENPARRMFFAGMPFSCSSSMSFRSC